MANTNKTSREHDSTWGASEPAKQAWDRQHGDTARKDAEKKNEAAARGERDA